MKTLVGFIYCETNGLHKTVPVQDKSSGIIYHKIPDVKPQFKNMFKFARLVVLNYSIGYYENKKYIETKKERLIIKPKSINFLEEAIKIHGITYKKALKKGVDPITAMEKFAEDFKHVRVLVSHNVEFHIKALQVELMRSCVYYDFGNLDIVDIISFNHELSYPKLKVLSEKFLGKSYEEKSQKYNLIIIRKVFFHLYKNYEENVLKEKNVKIKKSI